MAEAFYPVISAPVLVHLSPVLEMTDEQFFEFCHLNRDLRIERTSEGDLLIMPPTGARTGLRNFKLTAQLGDWLKTDQSGVAFDSSTGFILPNSAKRSPDLSWVSRSRLASLTDEQKEKFLPLCPDFVIELRSASDPLNDLQAKMEEYVQNGLRLGLLLDPQDRTAYVYKSDGAPEVLRNPEQLSCDPVLPGFRIDLREIWDADF
ncbi:MAG TPA: Uma2 family endonuclease [Pyrinomonadaceae bacterium]